MELTLYPTTLAICRLDPTRPIPAWFADAAGPFVSVTRTTDELSIVAPEEAVPRLVRAERGWRAFSIRGPLDLSLTGALADLAATLADAAIPIFAVSTFDTDWILVRATDADHTARLLQDAGHSVEPARD